MDDVRSAAWILGVVEDRIAEKDGVGLMLSHLRNGSTVAHRGPTAVQQARHGSPVNGISVA